VQGEADRPAEIEEVRAEGSSERLAERVTAKLRQAGLLTVVYGARNVRMELDGPLRSVGERGHVSVGELWALYARYPYLTRMKNRSVLDAAVGSVVGEIMWEQEGFALADEFDEAAGHYAGLRIPHEDSAPMVTDGTLLVAPPRAVAQCETEKDAAGVPVDPDRREGAEGHGRPAGPDASTGAAGTTGTTAPPLRRSFYGAVRVDPERYSRDRNRVAHEVLQHLAGTPGVDLEVTIEVRATAAGGFTDDKGPGGVGERSHAEVRDLRLRVRPALASG